MPNLMQKLTSAVRRKPATPPALPEPTTCSACGTDVGGSDEYRRLRVCPACGQHHTLPARLRIAHLADEGTFKEAHKSLVSRDPLSFSDSEPYSRRLQSARRRTGTAEGVVIGTCKIDGKSVVLAVLDFEFMGGSMGSVVGEKITLAFEMAAQKKMPIITVSTSGGARMQEGMLSLVQMAKTSAAAQRLQAAGLPFISILAHPTTGGIYASYASLGDINVAEPGALIGFAGPRVIAETTGRNLPPGSQRAEFLFEHGMVDMVVPRPRLRQQLSVLLGLLRSEYRLSVDRKAEHYTPVLRAKDSAWETVQVARHPERPTTLDYIRLTMSDFCELHGDRLYGDDPAMVGGIARLLGQTVVVVGQERGHGEDAGRRNGGHCRPEGYRKAARLMRLAARCRFPLITFIDTPGAALDLGSEERGLANSLSELLALMSSLPTPIVSVVVGEGGSGGALALGVADRILMLENAVYSVISPEGAAAILYRDGGKAADIAGALKLTAHDCRELGVIDRVVPEPPGGAHDDPAMAAYELRNFIVHELAEIQSVAPGELVKRRYKKFRAMGDVGSPFSALMAKEAAMIQEYARRLGGAVHHRGGEAVN